MDAIGSQTKLIQLGLLLFLIGLVNGAVVQKVRNPRMGLSAHLTGVQNGLVLIVFGLLWSRVPPTGALPTLAYWGALYSMYGLWLGLFLAAVWGTSRTTPLAGAGFSSTPP